MGQLFSAAAGVCLPAASNGARPDVIIVSNDKMYVMRFDAATDQAMSLWFILPRTPSGTISIKLHGIMASATTGSVRAEAAIGAYTPGDSTDLDTTFSLDTADNAGASVPGTAGYPFTITITQTHVDGWAAGDLIQLRINRDANGTTGTDDASGDWYFTGVEVVDTA